MMTSSCCRVRCTLPVVGSPPRIQVHIRCMVCVASIASQEVTKEHAVGTLPRVSSRGPMLDRNKSGENKSTKASLTCQDSWNFPLCQATCVVCFACPLRVVIVPRNSGVYRTHPEGDRKQGRTWSMCINFQKISSRTEPAAQRSGGSAVPATLSKYTTAPKVRNIFSQARLAVAVLARARANQT